MRKCNECEFTVKSTQPGMMGTAEELAAMADHLIQHNPSPAQWGEAHSRIQRAKHKPVQAEVGQ